MKFCEKCGKELFEEAVICTGCGCRVSNSNAVATANVVIESKKKTQVSLVLGIIGIVFAWVFALVGHITSVIGIVFGVREYKESGKISGLTLSIIGEVCSIISSIIGAVSMASVL